MTAPLSANAQVKVDVNDSCNCFKIFRRNRKDKNVVTVTDDVYHKTTIQIRRYTPEKTQSVQQTTTDITSHQYSVNK